jgi:DNA-binding response OmpR family regulator
MYEFQTGRGKQSGSRRHRLLVGENNPILRDYLFTIFKADGYEVVLVGSGNDLLDTVSVSLHPEFGSGEFDLVISEAHMLGTAELQSLTRLGSWARVPPFVFLASFGDKELHIKAKQFDAVAVLDKPLDFDNLRDLVNSFLRHPTAGHRDVPADS